MSGTSVTFAIEIVWDPLGTPFTFQSLFGGGTLNSETQTFQTFIDKHGVTPWDVLTIGTVSSLSANITYATALELEQFAGAVRDTDEVSMPGYSANSLRPTAKPVYVKPVENGAVNPDKAKWYHIPLATRPVLNYSNTHTGTDGQEIWNVTFHALAPEGAYEGKPIVFGVNTVV
jgi:hypothetical protein